MERVASLLARMADVSQPQKKFLLTLFTTILLLQGKVNFRNLSRYSELCEKTYARQYRTPFDFAQFNRFLIEELSCASHERIAAIDCSFIPKSGRQTYGLDRFYDACHKKPRQGLEISTIALIDVTTNRGYALHTQQTPPDAALADVVAANAPSAAPTEATELTRVDFYVSHLQAARAYLPSDVEYLVGDGYYAKLKFVEGTRAAGLHLISKLRGDADLRWLYDGPQKERGRKRQYDGKVRFDDLTRWQYVGEVESDLHLYTAVLNSVKLKCNIRVVYVLNQRHKQCPRYALLFSTDTDLDATTLYRYYRARFQIEFLFRDAKQYLGLADCQARASASLAFHFNASLTTLNIAKLDAVRAFGHDPTAPFSLASQKRVYFNEHLLACFSASLGLDLTSIKALPDYEALRTYGAIAA